MDETRLEERLLARATFGPRPGDREKIRDLGAEAWLAQELAAVPLGDAALEPRLARFPALAYGPADWLENDVLPDPAAMDAQPRQQAFVKLHARALQIGLQVAGARVVRAVHGSAGLREVIVDFWSNHFSVDARKGIVGGLLPHYQREVLDRFALGRFEDLLLAVAKSPAMLFYLANWSSSRQRGINENYARELLELHTLGVDGGYTQADVISVARALTGFSLASRRQPAYRFHPFLHDAEPKTVLGELPFLARTPAGHPETSERWIDPGAALERMRLAFALADGDRAIALAAPEFQWC